MVKSVQAIFCCQSNEDGIVRLTATYDEEKWKDFCEATPSGTIEIDLVGEDTPAAKFFEPGKDYRVVFAPV